MFKFKSKLQKAKDLIFNDRPSYKYNDKEMVHQYGTVLTSVPHIDRLVWDAKHDARKEKLEEVAKLPVFKYLPDYVIEKDGERYEVHELREAREPSDFEIYSSETQLPHYIWISGFDTLAKAKAAIKQYREQGGSTQIIHVMD